ncbi:DUF1778 domain-containing protein [Casimicrobium huifangae]|uniref:type II toxin -antitoxin system TacA 1-like antitoxin n=1 Tax=Casimicrobium huifangae TaxID=2591109 RepID=UPI003783E0F1
MRTVAITLRPSPTQRDLLARAAEAAAVDLGAFVLTAAVARAHAVVSGNVASASESVLDGALAGPVSNATANAGLKRLQRVTPPWRAPARDV